MMQKNIAEPIKNMVDSNLCTGCGTCVGVCPNRTLRIEMTYEGKYIPKIVSNNCQKCYLCIKVCPVSNENFKELNQFIFNKIPDNRLIGNFINCYRGYSTNSTIRWNATSGGLITSLLLFLLKNQLIDGALLVRINNNNPLKAEPFIARTKEEILSATGSKYVPVSMNQLLNQILSEDGRFAVVGLPCHMQGIRRAELKKRELRDKIIYHFGLTCSHTLNYNGIYFLLHKIGISKNEIIKLEYRGHGWPSGIRVSLKNGQQKFLPNQNSLWSEIFGGYFFTPYCCTLCYDHLNEMSDISFADAWLSEVMRNDRVGTSVVLTRTQKGEELIKESVSGKWIEVSTLSAEDVIRSQLWPLLFKKRNIKARIKLLKTFGRKLPKNLKEDMDTFIEPTSLDYIAAPSRI